jgi:hypothetical protein
VLSNPHVGQKVKVVNESCCDGFSEDTLGEIIKVEDDNHILVQPDDSIDEADSIWHCVLCLDEK